MLATVVAITTSDQSSPAASPSPPATIAQQIAAVPPQPAVNPAPPPVIAAPPPAFAAITPPPLQAPAIAQVAPTSRQCELAMRKFYVAGNGVVRIYASNYVSAPVTLGPYPQEVAFPVARPAPGIEAFDTIVVEGSASTVVMTSDVAGFRKVITGLRGSSSFTTRWLSLSNC